MRSLLSILRSISSLYDKCIVFKLPAHRAQAVHASGQETETIYLLFPDSLSFHHFRKREKKRTDSKGGHPYETHPCTPRLDARFSRHGR